MEKLHWLFKNMTKKRTILAAIALSLFAALCRQGVTYLLGETVTAASRNQLSSTVSQLIGLTAGIIILFVVDYVSQYLYGNFSIDNLYHFRTHMVQSTIGFTMKERAMFTTDTLVNRINNDMQILEHFFRDVIQDTSYKIFVGVFSIVLGFMINYQVMLVLLVMCAITIVIDYYFAKPMEKVQKQTQELFDRLMADFSDAVRGNKEIKTYGMKNTLKARFGDTVNAHIAKRFTSARIESMWEAVEITISIALQIGIVFLALFFVLRDEMTLGDVLVFQQITEMAKQLYIIDFISIRKTSAVVDRISEVWENQGEDSFPAGTIKIGKPNEPILNLKNVSFTYGNEQRQQGGKLSDINFTVFPGESVALVGPSGGGKSTIINLICGLLQPDKGTILFDGYGMADWDEQALYRQISLVDQECRLFPDSIYENIAAGGYGCTDVQQSQMDGLVGRAMESAALTDWVTSLENGIHTDIGEFGDRISGGQRQRIAIARALLKSPKLLLMDEPTSALDMRTEQEIIANVNRQISGETAILTVAHRLSTIQDYDKILVIDDGRIVEQGDHTSLMEQKGLYFRMYSQQYTGNQEGACT